MEPMIKLENIHQEFDGETILDNINLNIYEGEIVTIIGPSGAGKSTLLRFINLLNRPTSGKIYYLGEDIIQNRKKHHYYRSKISMVFQSFNLFNNYSVLNNCTLGLRKVLHVKKSEANLIAKKYLKMVGLENKINANISTLSGGQKQRVAIARSLSMNPDVILFDEPTSALDPEMVKDILDIIKTIATSGKTIIIVTHEINFAKNISDHILFMDHGHILKFATPDEIFNHNDNERINNFLKKVL